MMTVVGKINIDFFTDFDLDGLLKYILPLKSGGMEVKSPVRPWEVGPAPDL